MDQFARSNGYKDRPLTSQPTYKHAKLVRTKFFFSARYLWHAVQVRGNDEARRAEGIRVDVAGPPSWMKDIVEEKLVRGGILQPDFLNQVSLPLPSLTL